MIKSKLKLLLALHDSNQSKLAKEINVRQPTISAIANNTIKQIPIDVLNKICDYFNCQPGDIIEHVPDEMTKTNDTPEAESTPDDIKQSVSNGKISSIRYQSIYTGR